MFCTHTRYNILPFIYEFRYWLYFRLKYIIALCCKSRIKSRVTFGGLFEWNSRIRHVLNLNVSENTKCCGNIACSPLSFNRRILDRVQRMKLINSGDFTSCEWKKWIVFAEGKAVKIIFDLWRNLERAKCFAQMRDFRGKFTGASERYCMTIYHKSI